MPDIVCINCGKKISLPDSYDNYNGLIACPSCKMRMRVKIEFSKVKRVEPPVLKWIVCPNCGAAMPPEARFCGRCGHELPRKEGRTLQG